MSYLGQVQVSERGRTPEEIASTCRENVITTRLRNHLLASVSLPAALAVALLYLAAVSGGDDGKWLFRMGITFLVLAFVCGRITWISHNLRAMEHRVVELTRADQDRRRETRELMREIDSRQATIAAQQAFGRMAQRNGSRHLYSAHIEDTR